MWVVRYFYFWGNGFSALANRISKAARADWVARFQEYKPHCENFVEKKGATLRELHQRGSVILKSYNEDIVSHIFT